MGRKKIPDNKKKTNLVLTLSPEVKKRIKKASKEVMVTPSMLVELMLNEYIR